MDIVKWIAQGRLARFVWAGVAVLMLGGLLIATIADSADLEQRRTAAELRAERYARAVLSRGLLARDLDGSIPASTLEDLRVAVKRGIMTDSRVARVRIWQPDGILVFSTDGRDLVGEPYPGFIGRIDAVIEGGTVSALGESIDPAFSGESDTEIVLKTFVPLRASNDGDPVAAAEIHTTYGEGWWRTLRIVFGLGMLLSIIMVGIAVRGRVLLAQSSFGFLRRSPEQPAARADAIAAQPAEPTAAVSAQLRQRLDRAESDARTAREELEETRGRLERAVAAYRALEAKVEQDVASVSGDEQVRELAERLRAAEQDAGAALQRAESAEMRAAELEQRIQAGEKHTELAGEHAGD